MFQNGTRVLFLVRVRGSVEADEYLIRLTMRRSHHSKQTNLRAVGTNGIIQRSEGKKLREINTREPIHCKSQPSSRGSPLTDASVYHGGGGGGGSYTVKRILKSII